MVGGVMDNLTWSGWISPKDVPAKVWEHYAEAVAQSGLAVPFETHLRPSKQHSTDGMDVIEIVSTNATQVFGMLYDLSSPQWAS